MPTHYKIDWSIDIWYLEEQVIIMKEKWIDTILVAWTTWESFSMTHNEQSKYIKQAIEIGQKYKINILAWTWGNSMIEQESMTKNAFKSWASACLILPPYYIKLSYIWMLEHFASALQHWPCIIYSIKWRTSIEVPNEVIKALKYKFPNNLLWVKECDWSEKIKELVESGIQVWTWNDDVSIKDIKEKWAIWAISVIANLDPTLMLKISSKEILTQKDISRVEILSKLMFPAGYPNPLAIHNATYMIRYKLNKNIPVFRDNQWPFNNNQQEYIKNWLDYLDIPAEVFWENYIWLKKESDISRKEIIPK